MYGRSSPMATELKLYEAVVWTTGESETQTIDLAADIQLRAYLDQGGRLFLSSHGIVDERGVGAFTLNYLRYTSPLTQDVGATVGNGLAGAGVEERRRAALAAPPASGSVALQPHGIHSH